MSKKWRRGVTCLMALTLTVTNLQQEVMAEELSTADTAAIATAEQLEHSGNSMQEEADSTEQEGSDIQESEAKTVTEEQTENDTVEESEAEMENDSTLISEDDVVSNEIKAPQSVSEVSIVKQPQSYEGVVGSYASFTIEAKGEGLSYQWQYSTDGNRWYNSSIKTSVYSTALAEDRNGRKIRCIVTDIYGTNVISEVVAMSIITSEVRIIKQPQSYEGTIGSYASFSIVAEGEGLSYQWQYSTDGNRWYNSSVKTAVYSTALAEDRNGRKVRCIVTDTYGTSVTSEIVSMSIIKSEVSIVKQPQNYEGSIGSFPKFTLEAEGEELSYQWQYSDNGNTWYNSSVKASVYSTVLSEDRNGRKIRCIVTDIYGTSVTSEIVTMSIIKSEVSIVKQPQNYEGAIGSSPKFTIEAEGEGLSYQWQYSDNGNTWYNSSIKTDEYSTVLTSDRDGRQIRCIVTDTYGTSVTSNVVTMHKIISEVTIVTQPESYEGLSGSYASFTIEAEGIGMSYTWQYSIDGNRWYNSSINGAMYSTLLTADRDGRQIRCIVTDEYGTTVTSDIVIMKIAKIEINRHPESYKGLENDVVTFEVIANGTDLSYQWQMSDNGGSKWYNGSIKTASYSTLLNSSNSGRLIRCQIRDKYGNEMFSDTATMEINNQFERGFVVRNAKTYYRYADGSYAVGLTEIDGETYYFNEKNKAMSTGMGVINGKRYYFDLHTGKAVTGLTYVESNGNTYYFHGGQGAHVGLLQTEEGTRYFNEIGIMLNGLLQIDGKLFYFQKDSGLAAEGFFRTPDTGQIYYFDGQQGAIGKGFQTIGGQTYYFQQDGVVARGLTRIAGQRYYFNVDTGELEKGKITTGIATFAYAGEDGICLSGLQEIGGKLYYFDPVSNNAMTGMQVIGEKTYFFDKKTYEAQNGFYTVEDHTYYFDDNYQMVTGYQRINKKLYYFDEKGRMYKGMLKDTGKMYCFSEETGEAMSGWYTSALGNVYYFSPDHYEALTGSVEIAGKKYFFYDSGILRTGIIHDDNNVYCYSETGEIVTGFIEDRGCVYYFDTESQKAAVGLNEIDGKLYYFSQWAIMQCGRIDLEAGKYYFGNENGSAISGFVNSSGGGVYYYDTVTYTMVTGLREIDGETYYFGENGTMHKGYCNINGALYYFDTKTGAAISGFACYVNAEGISTMVFADGETKQLQTGLISINGDYYLFSDSGIMKTGLQTVDGQTYYFDEITGKARKGFVAVSGNTINFFKDTGERVSGAQIIDGNSYVFTDAGTRLTGLATAENIRYYLDSQTGIALSGRIENPDNNRTYVMLTNGGVANGLVSYWGTESAVSGSSGVVIASGTNTIDGFQYYFDEHGERQYGLITYKTSSGISSTQYFGKTANIGGASRLMAIRQALEEACMSDGWHEVEGLRYYTSNGSLSAGIVQIDGKKYGFSTLTNVLLHGLRKIDGKLYYLAEDGSVQTGFITVDGEIRYFNPTTGIMATGFQEINGKQYYFLSNGIAASGTFMVDGKRYCASTQDHSLVTNNNGYDEHGAFKQPHWLTKNGNTYYVDSTGAYVTGICIIDGAYFYFDDSGCKTEGFYMVNNSIKYFDADGMVTGWTRMNSNTYYFNPKDGSAATGICVIDQKTYYFHSDGKLATGFVKADDGTTRYFTDQGMLKGVQEIGNATYYFDESGIMKTGMVTIEDKTYYFDEHGRKCFGEISYSGKHYYFEQVTGERKTGLVEIDGKTYYFSPATGIRLSGIREIAGKTYFFNTLSGIRTTGFVSHGNKMYYFDDSACGYMTGLKKIEGKIYYFNPDDGRVMTGFRDLDGVKYYFDAVTGESQNGIFQIAEGVSYYFVADGGILFGLQQFEGKDFYFYPTNGKKTDGLQSIGNKLYYFDENLGMLKNTTVTIAGINYVLDVNGIASVEMVSPVTRIIQEGLKYLGQPYKEETETGTALSCSGYIYTIFGTENVNLPGAVYQQGYNAINNPNYMVITDIADARPGDLIYYTNMNCPYGDECGYWNEIHHVAMYLDDGKVLHSTPHGNVDHPELDCVQVENLNGSEQFTVYTIVRIFNK